MTTDNSSQAPDGDEDPRLGSLEDRLKAAHHAEADRIVPLGATAASAFNGKGGSQGNRVLSTLIGAPLGAALIGWLLDRWLNTSPTALLILLSLGIVSAFVQIWRISQERAE
jgi:ATP synthase protein I